MELNILTVEHESIEHNVSKHMIFLLKHLQLWILKINDMGLLKSKSQQTGCRYAGTLINHLMYADDLGIFLPVLLV